MKKGAVNFEMAKPGDVRGKKKKGGGGCRLQISTETQRVSRVNKK